MTFWQRNRNLLLAILLVALATLSTAAAKDVDPRLATISRAYIRAGDPLTDDQTVATCVVEHLPRYVPLTLVAESEADVVLTVHHAHAVKHPTAKITASLPDGTVLWDGGSKTRGLNLLELNARCVLADDLLQNLRDAMRKARDKQ